MPQLSLDIKQNPLITITLPTIPYATFRHLICYWYTAQFHSFDEQSPLSSSLDNLSLNNTPPQSPDNDSIRQSINQLEQQLDVTLMPTHPSNDPHADNDQWRADLQRMLDDQIQTDVIVNTFKVPSKGTHSEDSPTQPSIEENASIPAHRFILASQSPYFYSVFCTEFREASTSSLHLPADLFSPLTLRVILYYLYTDQLILPPIPSSAQSIKIQKHIARLNEKKHQLRILQKVFLAADFLGHFNTLCKATLAKMSLLCHQFKCTCSDCILLLPSMLLFSDKNESHVPELRSKLLSLYADPMDSLATLWSQKPFCILVNSMSTDHPEQPHSAVALTANKNSSDAISLLFNNSNKISHNTATSPISIVVSDHSPSDLNSKDLNLISELSERTFSNITKNNSVRVLHSLHLCLSYLRAADPLPTWSHHTLNILNTFVHHTVDVISTNFDYYCVEYPILLSCIDGIGYGFSVDFLGFVLNKVINEGMHDGNAAEIYQNIVRDLGGRQEMVKNVAVESVLLEARIKCAQYISKRWMSIKAEEGFHDLEKETLRVLSEDINVPIRNLVKPIENDFSTMFSFMPKKAPNTTVSKAVSSINNNDANLPHKRMSVGNSSSNSLHLQRLESNQGRQGRTRSLSASNNSPESILRKDNILYSDNEEPVTHPSFRRNSIGHPFTYKRHGSTGSLTDELLPIDCLKKSESKEPSKTEVTPRPTRLRFSLPETPSRAKSPMGRVSSHQVNGSTLSASGHKKRAKSPRRSKWSLGYNTSDSSDEESHHTKAEIGHRVELLRRPLPTQGVIKYIGPVEFALGIWVGIELDSRLGNNDGSVDGKRYFQTSTQKGVFVKMDDFKVIVNEKK
ncbi:hypothetical protein BDB01DRAFT_785295 [Pilobolus umbonatus]|nr:hypothetical protein BDB01DRAFT_785295 [Pilobolus umbonatus]